jgi:FtsP/CotA-like multicopper oxidase with cupredoxin domain
MHIHGGDFVELLAGGATGPWMDTIVVDANVGGCCALETRALLSCGMQSQKTVLVRFGTEPGVFMQHCHMLEHEDNEASPSQLACSPLKRTSR